MISPSDPSPPTRPTLATLTGAQVVGSLGIAMIMAMALAIQKDLQLTQTQFGSLIASYYAGQIVLALPGGWLVDRIGIRGSLLVAAISVAAALLILFGTHAAAGAAFALALLGLGTSLISPATSKGVLVWMPPSRRGFAMGVKQCGVPVGGMLAAALAIAALQVGWRNALLFGVTLAGAGIVSAFVLPRRKSRDRGGSLRTVIADMSTVVRNRVLFRAGMCNSIYNLGQVALWTYVSVFLVKSLGTTPSTAGLCFGALHLSSAVGRIVWGRLSDRDPERGRHAAATRVGVIGAIAFAALAVPAGVVPAIATIVVLGFSIGGFPSLVHTIAVESVERRHAASAIGYNMLLVLPGAILCPIAVGALLDAGVGFSAVWLLLSAVVAGGAFLVARSPAPRAAQEPALGHDLAKRA